MTDVEWYAERGAHRKILYKVRQNIYSGRSQYQEIDILDTEEYGRMLFLDGVAQSSERDEYIYHECLVHPAALTHPNPQTACVIGGAEGATLRELYKHPDITKIVMVDIDGEVVDLCKKHLPNWSSGAYEDPRTTLLIEDGRKYLAETKEKFDLILGDLPDPLGDSPAKYLFTKEFYQIISDRLTENGAACFQGESLQPWRLRLHARMANTLKTIFPFVAAIPYNQPSFHEIHAMLLVSKSIDPKATDLAARMEHRNLVLKYLSPGFLGGIFNVPAYVEKAYSEFPAILTDNNPDSIKDR